MKPPHKKWQYAKAGDIAPTQCQNESIPSISLILCMLVTNYITIQR